MTKQVVDNTPSPRGNKSRTDWSRILVLSVIDQGPRVLSALKLASAAGKPSGSFEWVGECVTLHAGPLECEQRPIRAPIHPIPLHSHFPNGGVPEDLSRRLKPVVNSVPFSSLA